MEDEKIKTSVGKENEETQTIRKMRMSDPSRGKVRKIALCRYQTERVEMRCLR